MKYDDIQLAEILKKERQRWSTMILKSDQVQRKHLLNIFQDRIQKFSERLQKQQYMRMNLEPEQYIKYIQSSADYSIQLLAKEEFGVQIIEQEFTQGQKRIPIQRDQCRLTDHEKRLNEIQLAYLTIKSKREQDQPAYYQFYKDLLRDEIMNRQHLKHFECVYPGEIKLYIQDNRYTIVTIRGKKYRLYYSTWKGAGFKKKQVKFNQRPFKSQSCNIERGMWTKLYYGNSMTKQEKEIHNFNQVKYDILVSKRKIRKIKHDLSKGRVKDAIAQIKQQNELYLTNLNKQKILKAEQEVKEIVSRQKRRYYIQNYLLRQASIQKCGIILPYMRTSKRRHNDEMLLEGCYQYEPPIRIEEDSNYSQQEFIISKLRQGQKLYLDSFI